LEKLTRIFFNERRKKNKKKIIKVFSDDQILEHNLKRFYDLRPENLDNKVFFELCDILKL
jgi:16S rRNA A1518/A1519 N6-dimethyltransferase RsmA/KsgA/DIM1 with predicted DNA glycosylase/AP lyase activity